MAKPKHVCKPTKEKTTGAVLVKRIGDLDWRSQPVPMKAPGGKVRKRAPDYITSEVVPGPMSVTTKEKCSFTEKGEKIKIRKCDTSLQFVGPSTTGSMGVPEGAYLRICTKFGADPIMVPVKNHSEAMKKAKRICGCVSSGETSKKCAQKIVGAKKPKLKRRPSKQSSKAGEEKECLRWSKNGNRCLRRAKS